MARRWEHSFKTQDSFQRRQASHQPPPAASDGQRRCAQGTWCLSPVLTRQDDGTFKREAGYTYQPFCHRDRGVVIEKLEGFPSAYARLAVEGSLLRRAGSTVRMPYGPKIPLHEGMDALRREIALTLGSWHARVAAVANLTQPLGLAVLGGGKESVKAAARVLPVNIDVLLGLPPAWMTRRVPIPPRLHSVPPSRFPDWLPSGHLQPPKPGWEPIPSDVADRYADAEIVRIGSDYLTVLVELDGEAAGLEILRLHHRAERLLGEVRQRADTLDGVPCHECEDMALERAEPPSDPAMPEMFSRCASCHHMMTRAEYQDWAGRYAGWARSVSLSCRRCQLGRHEECVYGKCECQACGHLAA